MIPIINELLRKVQFDAVAYTLDWHPENHCSFIENVNYRTISQASPVVLRMK